MFKERIDQQAERERGIITTPSAAEELTQPSKHQAEWLKDIASNAEFERQVRERQLLIERLDAVVSQIPRPDTSFQTAIREGLVTEKSVADLYRSLTGLLGADSDYRRVALYLPFEFFPDKHWLAKSKELNSEIDAFKTSYVETWKRLLYVHDVRANFVDGDVLEVDQRRGELEYVVKAAHLIPKLIESGIIELDEILEFIASNDHPTLRSSVEDALAVTNDLVPFSQKDLSKIKHAGFDLGHYPAEANSISSVDAADVNPASIEKRMADRFAAINQKSYEGVTANREKWLKKTEGARALSQESEMIRIGIENDLLLPEQLEDILDLSPLTQLAVIDGIRKAIESLGYDGSDGKVLYTKYQKILIAFWRAGDPSLHSALTKAFCHFHALGIVGDEQLMQLGIRIPVLEGPFSKNLELLDGELSRTKRAIGSIREHTELSRFVYPSAILAGSKLKGYGDVNSDTDIGVFIRPNTPPEERGRITEILYQIFKHESLDPEEIKEFWLTEEGGDLEVRDDIYNERIGESTWHHLLFAGAWEGDEQETLDLKKHLLIPYFYETEKVAYDRNARDICLEEMERGTLQYRLMHRGYEQFYPSFGGISTPRSNAIDGQSAFYDSGYRRTATMLFARNVFLPKLKR